MYQNINNVLLINGELEVHPLSNNENLAYYNNAYNEKIIQVLCLKNGIKLKEE